MPIEPGETVVWTRLANHSLGARAVGGKLYLTDRRLLFRPHILERHFYSGKEWSAPRSELSGFEVKRRGGANPFNGSLRSRLRATLREGEPQLFVVWRPERDARQLNEALGTH